MERFTKCRGSLVRSFSKAKETQMSRIPNKLSLYREESYWDERYKGGDNSDGSDTNNDDNDNINNNNNTDVNNDNISKSARKRTLKKANKNYDWLMEYNSTNKNKPSLKPLIKEELDKRKGGKILILGCGNSTLSYDLHIDGYGPVVSVDYSQTIIDILKERHSSQSGMVFIRADIKNMSSLEDGSFSTIIDKGTLDAIFCDNSSLWDPSTTVRNDIKSCVAEIQRLMSEDSIFISVSFGQPHFRLPLLQSPFWTLKAEEIDGTFCHLYQAELV